VMMKLLEAERLQDEMETPRYTQKKSSSNVPVFFKGSTMVNGPQSLAIENSSHNNPTNGNKKKPKTKTKNTARLSILSIRERTEHSQNITKPKSVEEFLEMDFVSRCAIAGLQLGRTKVFLRREAFDRIESMRSGKFYGSAVRIQSIVRGKIRRDLFLQMRWAAVVIQKESRRRAAIEFVARYRIAVTATRIQCA